MDHPQVSSNLGKRDSLRLPRSWEDHGSLQDVPRTFAGDFIANRADLLCSGERGAFSLLSFVFKKRKYSYRRF